MFRYLIRTSVLILPVLEFRDAWRLQQIADRVLIDIVAHRVRAVVFDFSDVAAVHDAVARQLAQMMNAYQHLGITVAAVRLLPIIENGLITAGLIIDDMIREADLEAGVEKARQGRSANAN